MIRGGLTAMLAAIALAVACGKDGASTLGESCAATSDCMGDLRCVGQVCRCQCDVGQTCNASGQCEDVATGLDWVALPGGTYQMGATTGSPNEEPLHAVTLSGFEMGRTEVTVAQYGACVTEGACAVAKTGEGCNQGVAGKETHPINCVDWNQSNAYCEWAGARLCTEAEWEYAARSGGKSQEFPWGGEAPTCQYAVWTGSGAGANGCERGRTMPVCSKTVGNSEQGICDLAGNAWEWVADWYGDYPSDPQTDPTGPASGPYRVNRGGSWRSDSGPDDLRASYRPYYDGPYLDYDDLGLRCCRSSN